VPEGFNRQAAEEEEIGTAKGGFDPRTIGASTAHAQRDVRSPHGVCQKGLTAKPPRRRRSEPPRGRVIRSANGRRVDRVRGAEDARTIGANARGICDLDAIEATVDRSTMSIVTRHVDDLDRRPPSISL
jgi:hypothetical protein